MKRIQDYEVLGESYKTKSGNTIRIREKIEKDGLSEFIVECSRCSLDEELFPYGSIIIDIRKFREKRCSCLCSKTPQLTLKQKSIRCKRILEKYFAEFKSIFYKDSTCFVEVENPVTKEIKSFRYEHLINEKVSLKTLDFISHLESEISLGGNFNLYPVLNPVSRNNWLLHCHRCSEDIYTESGTCTGMFPTRLDRLKESIFPCRCSDKYRYTIDQWTLRSKIACERSNYKFLGLKDTDKRNWKISYICPKGHQRSSFMKPFVLQGKRCKLCSKDSYNTAGYYPDRVEELDTLYLTLFEGDDVFCKIGRSFNTKSRNSNYPNEYKLTVLSEIKLTHQEVWDMEQMLHDVCKGAHYSPLISFKGSVKECFTTDILNHPEIISTFNLKEIAND
tara:strand:+ start:23880 stop:25052 length:1173 start_codon:yes stop_codon:yes gene_type:complete